MHDQTFKCQPSNYYCLLLASVFALTAFIIFQLPLNLVMKALLFLLASVYVGTIGWRFGLLKSKQSIQSIRLHTDGSWHIYTKNKAYSAILRPESIVTNVISLLRFKVAESRWPIACIIFPDSLDKDSYRQLLMNLKMR